MAFFDAQTNIMLFNSKLNEFRDSGRYCDVDIKVGERSFRCHRLVLTLATEYFDAMFNGHFQESKAKTITLEDVDASTFEEVLRFVYTGNAIVNKENAFSLLRASEFFKLDGVEKLCTRFMKYNLPIPEMFDALAYTRLTQKTSLVYVLSRYIMKHLDEYAADDLFLKVSFDDLSVLLSQRWHLSPKNEDTLMDTLIRWVNYERDTRVKYFEELIENVQLKDLSVDYMKFTMTTLMLGKSTDQPRFPISNANPPISNAGPPIKPSLGLHVYIAGENDYRKTRVYSVNKSAPSWTISHTIDHRYEYNDMGLIGLDNYLYCLDDRTFRVGTSLDTSPGCSHFSTLRYPPVPLSNGRHVPILMCNIQNNIFVHSRFSTSSSSSYAAASPLSEEQISQGIFVYNGDIDEWSPVPLLRNRLSSSTITAYNNVLYYVAGRTVNEFSMVTSENNISIQSLDFRTSNWQNLTNNLVPISDSSVGSAYLCVVLDGKIFVCPESPDPNTHQFKVKSYDLTANKWAKVEPISDKFSVICHLLQYENLLWAVGPSEFFRTDDEDFLVSTYNARIDGWYKAPIDGMLGMTIWSEDLEGKLAQAVIFKC